MEFSTNLRRPDSARGRPPGAIALRDGPAWAGNGRIRTVLARLSHSWTRDAGRGNAPAGWAVLMSPSHSWTRVSWS